MRNAKEAQAFLDEIGFRRGIDATVGKKFGLPEVRAKIKVACRLIVDEERKALQITISVPSRRRRRSAPVEAPAKTSTKEG